MNSEIIKSDKNSSSLDAREQDRLDCLLSSARRFHGAAFIVAALSVAMASLVTKSPVRLPVGDFVLPPVQAAVGAYILTICLCIITDGLFRMAIPWLPLDPRQPPFAWYPLMRMPKNRIAISLVIASPAFLAALGAATILAHDFDGIGLLFVGFFLVFLPRIIEDYVPHIQARRGQGVEEGRGSNL